MKKIKLTENQVKMLQSLKPRKIKISESQLRKLVEDEKSSQYINTDT